MPYYRNPYSAEAKADFWERIELNQEFGGVDLDVEKAFFELSVFQFEPLLQDYGARYGRSAENEVRRNYERWRKRELQVSAEIRSRIIELLPPYLSKEQRFDLIEKLRAHCLDRTKEYVVTSPNNWRQNVVPAVDKVIRFGRNFSLPEELVEQATWLANGDAQVAHQILFSVEEEETRQQTAYLEKEYQQIEYLVETLRGQKTISHTISIPHGDIYVTVETRKLPLLKLLLGKGSVGMDKENNELVPVDDLSGALVPQQERKSLLDRTLDDLSPEERAEYNRKIISKQIDLDESRAKAEQRHINSTRDLGNTIGAAQRLDQLGGDSTIREESETASGTRVIKVTKNNNTVIIVVAIVIGIVAVLILMSR